MNVSEGGQHKSYLSKRTAGLGQSVTRSTLRNQRIAAAIVRVGPAPGTVPSNENIASVRLSTDYNVCICRFRLRQMQYNSSFLDSTGNHWVLQFL